MNSNNHAEPAHGSSSPQDIQDFLKHLKTRDTEEVLGTSASHTLAGAIGQATAVTVALMVIFTFGPMVVSSPPAAPAPTAKSPEVRAETPEPARTPATPTTPTPPTVAATTPATPANAKDAMDKIGANDTKQASPKVNPLDKSVDDLFKDLDKK
jgi:hypothetical protein